MIRRALKEGHEVGLHGGFNHGTWQAKAKKWNERRTAREVDFGRQRLLKAAGVTNDQQYRVCGFASPGWQGPSALWRILADRGFDYVADRRGRHHEIDLAPIRQKLFRIPTHLVGEPGGVAYLEHHHALGSTTAEVISEFEGALRDNRRRSLVLYDHPYFAGIQKLNLLRKMIEVGRRAGYQTATLSELLTQHRGLNTP